MSNDSSMSISASVDAASAVTVTANVTVYQTATELLTVLGTAFTTSYTASTSPPLASSTSISGAGSGYVSKTAPYPPTPASLGGIPNTEAEGPILTALICVFLLGAIGHAIIFQWNRRQGHKFLPSMMIVVFCLLKIITCALRLAWSRKQRNMSLALASQIFNNIGSVIFILINILFTQRILRSNQPKTGWSTPARATISLYVVSLPSTIVLLVIAGIWECYTLNPATLAGLKSTLLFGATYLAVAAFWPLMMVPLAVFHRHDTSNQHSVEKFGEGRHRVKVAVVLVGAALVFIGAVFRDIVTFQAARPIADPAWYQSRVCFYLFGFALDVLIVFLYLACRVDRRFHIPDGARQPGDYHENYVMRPAPVPGRPSDKEKSPVVLADDASESWHSVQEFNKAGKPRRGRCEWQSKGITLTDMMHEDPDRITRIEDVDSIQGRASHDFALHSKRSGDALSNASDLNFDWKPRRRPVTTEGSSMHGTLHDSDIGAQQMRGPSTPVTTDKNTSGAQRTSWLPALPTLPGSPYTSNHGAEATPEPNSPSSPLRTHSFDFNSPPPAFLSVDPASPRRVSAEAERRERSYDRTVYGRGSQEARRSGDGRYRTNSFGGTTVGTPSVMFASRSGSPTRTNGRPSTDSRDTRPGTRSGVEWLRNDGSVAGSARME